LPYPNFSFHKLDLTDRDAILALANASPAIDNIVHLAAQAGVRYSIENPFAYADANLIGYLNILELGRRLPGLKHLVYASSSSVYGANQKLPFSVHDPVDQPMSLYAATKRANELMGYTYAHLYKIPLTGLRFFTVYGPWGRPDMSAFIFTKAILNDKPIPVFNHGDMRRNFTYIADIVQGVIRCLQNPPTNNPSHRVYNIGNNTSVALMDFIGHLEQHLGKKAHIDYQPMQPGDVKETIADISDTQRDFGFEPTTQVAVGLGHFTKWYRAYYG
jgi:UDP-glucuronate 4-epimerase